jgi:hypothetical protein
VPLVSHSTPVNPELHTQTNPLHLPFPLHTTVACLLGEATLGPEITFAAQEAEVGLDVLVEGAGDPEGAEVEGAVVGTCVTGGSVKGVVDDGGIVALGQVGMSVPRSSPPGYVTV